MKKIILLIILLASFVHAEEILVKGKLVDELTGEPISGAELMSAYEFSPSQVITDSDGNFGFGVDINFRVKGSTQPEIGGQWSFAKKCYNYASVVLQRDRNGYSLAHIDIPFDGEEIVNDVSRMRVIDIGELKAYPMSTCAASNTPARSQR